MHQLLTCVALAMFAAGNPSPRAADGDTEADAVIVASVIDYREAPVHIRPVREHPAEPDQTFDESQGARHGSDVPPETALSGREHRPSDLLATSYLSVDRGTDCQPMSRKASEMCSMFNYTMTRVPNLLNHETQVEAYQQLVGYRELIRSNCASDLLFLLCSYHLPSCQPASDVDYITQDEDGITHVALVTPCRSLCERVRDACSPLLRRYGFEWPWSMQCDRLQSEPTIVEPQSGLMVGCMNEPPSQRHAPALPQSQNVSNSTNCDARTCASQELKRKTFKSHRYDWVVLCRHFGMIVKDRKHGLQVRVTSVLYKRAGTPRRMKRGREVIILTDQEESNCEPCPRMDAFNTTYLLAGHSQGSRLVYRINDGLAADGSLVNPKRVKKWLKSLSRLYPVA